MDTQFKRNSKSQNLEECICLLTQSINQNISDEEIKSMIINNSLPVELRSFLWRVLLGIIPKTKDPLEINKAITAYRKAFEVMITFHKDIEAKFSIDNIKEQTIREDMDKAMKEIDRLSTRSDFLKSQSIITSIIKLYYLWRINTKYEGYYSQPIFILASVAFAVFPAALRPGDSGITEITSMDNATPQNMYYLINNEDYFEADVYSIFSSIMTKLNIVNICIDQGSKKELNNVINYNQMIDEMKDANLRSLQSKLDLHHKLSFLYIYIACKDVISLFNTYQFDPYPIFVNWYTFLFTNIFQLNNINYLWDIILISKNFNEMGCYIIGAITKMLKSKLLSSTSSEEIRVILEHAKNIT